MATATLSLLPEETTAPVDVAQPQPPQESMPAAPKRHPQDTWLLTTALLDTMPRALENVRDIVEDAKAGTLPCRSQKWRSRRVDKHGNPLQSGTRTQDPNLRIASRANAFLLLMENRLAGVDTPEDADHARLIIVELNAWADELRPVLEARAKYEAALKVYQDAAPERID